MQEATQWDECFTKIWNDRDILIPSFKAIVTGMEMEMKIEMEMEMKMEMEMEVNDLPPRVAQDEARYQEQCRVMYARLRQAQSGMPNNLETKEIEFLTAAIEFLR